MALSDKRRNLERFSAKRNRNSMMLFHEVEKPEGKQAALLQPRETILCLFVALPAFMRLPSIIDRTASSGFSVSIGSLAKFFPD